MPKYKGNAWKKLEVHGFIIRSSKLSQHVQVIWLGLVELWGVFRTQPNIYDGAFSQQKNSIADAWLGSKYASEAASSLAIKWIQLSDWEHLITLNISRNLLGNWRLLFQFTKFNAWSKSQSLFYKHRKSTFISSKDCSICYRGNNLTYFNSKVCLL